MHVLITGASKGIGLATAKKFAEAGAALSFCSRNESELLRAKHEIENEFQSPLFASVCDVSNEHAVQKFVTESQGNLGPIDLLINNAGFGLFKAVTEMTVNDFESVLATNLRGVFLMTQAVLPEMKARKQGTIVTVSSLAGRNGFAGGAAYCASKFGVRGLMQSLFLDVRSHNIRVITIFPGSVNTAFFDRAGHPLGNRASSVLAEGDVADAIYSAHMQRTGATISELDLRPTHPA
ncbi:MAG TPA: SDR family NAD(P)-dependent oxidoreductase [Candidatus Kapabacteria bacterium]|jgi:NADP-dependent 3-hydroxy acid dehydrogenase YdfG